MAVGAAVGYYAMVIFGALSLAFAILGRAQVADGGKCSRAPEMQSAEATRTRHTAETHGVSRRYAPARVALRALHPPPATQASAQSGQLGAAGPALHRHGARLFATLHGR